MLCTVNLSGFPLPKSFIAPLTIAAVILASFFLAACGGGGPAPTQVPTPVPATPAPPATEPPTPPTTAPAPTAPPAVTGSQGSGAATPDSPTASPTVPPAATADPTVAPTEILASNAVRVLQRSCVEDFRQMLLDYDGDEFDAEVVRRLSDEFTGLRPGCLEQGWDPEFPIEPEVCLRTDSMGSRLSYKRNPRSELVYLLPTMRTEPSLLDGSFELQVHFTRIPLLSMVPPHMLPVRPGEAVGGCWLYEGPPDGGGKWTQSLVMYRGGAIHPDVGLMDRDRTGMDVNVPLRNSYPECDLLLQEAVSARLDAGEVPDASAVMGLMEEVRTQAGGACGQGDSREWMYVSTPMDGAAGACPETPLTGLQDNGDFVLNWGEYHFDGYGRSACWIRSPDGEWVGYLRE